MTWRLHLLCRPCAAGSLQYGCDRKWKIGLKKTYPTMAHATTASVALNSRLRSSRRCSTRVIRPSGFLGERRGARRRSASAVIEGVGVAGSALLFALLLLRRGG